MSYHHLLKQSNLLIALLNEEQLSMLLDCLNHLCHHIVFCHYCLNS